MTKAAHPQQIHSETLIYTQNSTQLISAISSLDTPVCLQSKGADNGSSTDIYTALPETSWQNINNNKKEIQSQLNRYAIDSNCHFPGGLVFCGSYDEGAEQQIHLNKAPSQASFAAFYLWSIEINHSKQTSTLYWHPDIDATKLQLIKDTLTTTLSSNNSAFRLITPFESLTTKESYINSFNKTQHYIQSGDCYQINLSQGFKSDYSGSPIDAYLVLSSECPTPFSGYMRFSDGDSETEVLCLSPERFISLKDNQLESKPIKGTRPRGKSAEEDAKLAIELKNSPKDRAENLMIVDLLRNDLSKHAIPGSVKVPKLFDIEHFPNVHHLVSTVTAKITPNSIPLEVLLDAFPGGSITGAPKKRAMEIIDELEPVNRSFYCGSMGYIGLNGNMDSNIMIRTLVCKDGEIRCWGGGGIVADSEAENEYQESITKVKILLDTLEEMSGF